MICPHDIIEKDNACADGMCPICLIAEIERVRRSTEPNRQTPYRRLYVHIYKFKEEIARQDSINGYLLNEIRALQRRVDKLEQHKTNWINVTN